MSERHLVRHMSRPDFVREFGHIPEPSSVGMIWVAEDRKTICYEVIFTDNEDVAELERIHSLPSGDSR